MNGAHGELQDGLTEPGASTSGVRTPKVLRAGATGGEGRSAKLGVAPFAVGANQGSTDAQWFACDLARSSVGSGRSRERGALGRGRTFLRRFGDGLLGSTCKATSSRHAP